MDKIPDTKAAASDENQLPKGGGSLERMVRPNLPEPRYPDDVFRLKAALNQLGYDADPADISDAYGDYSEEEMCASWLTMDIWKTDEAAARCLINNGYLVKANVRDDVPGTAGTSGARREATSTQRDSSGGLRRSLG